MIFLVFHIYYILAHILQRKKIIAALLISYSAFESSKSPVIHSFFKKPQPSELLKILAISGLKVA